MSNKDIILKHLNAAGGNAISVRKLQTWVLPDLARALSTAQITLLLQEMEKSGWVTFLDDEVDNITLWLITQKGKALLLSRVNE